MPEEIMLHVFHTVAGNRISDDDGGFFTHSMGAFYGRDEISDGISRTSHDIEIEGLKLLCQRFQGHDVFRGAVDLDVVAVDDEGAVVELVACGKQQSLPRLSRFQFAITHHAVDTPRRTVQQRGIRQTDGL